MRSLISNICISLTLLFFMCIFSSLANLNDAPKILSKFETILEVNQNYSVICEGTEELQWIVPKYIKNNNNSYSTKFVEEKLESSDSHKLKLTIINMTYSFVGYYFCTYRNNKQAKDEIYLYLSDNEHFALNNVTKTIFTTQHEDIFIPCKPTSPEVKVKLMKFLGKKEIQMDVLRRNTFYHYNPLYGFYSNDTKRVGKLMLLCVYEKDGINRTEKQRIDLVIEALNQLALPSITIKNGTKTVGGVLILECAVASTSPYVTFEWKTPSGDIDKERMNVSELTREATYSWIIQSLVITETKLSDRGIFECIVRDHQSHVTSSDIDIKIFDTDEHFLYLGESSDVYELNKTVGGEAEWIIHVNAYPEPRFTWFNNENNTIEMFETEKYRSEITNEYIKLIIKNVSIHDFGNYLLIAQNNFETIKRDLVLQVSGKPEIAIQSEKFVISNSENFVECTVLAFPQVDIFWEYQQCQDRNCNISEVKSLTTQLTATKYISVVTFTANQSGLIKCIANNTFGTEDKTVAFYETDIPKGFDIIQIDEVIDFKKETKEAIAPLNDTVSLTCGATVQNFSQLLWLYNNAIISYSDKYELQSSRTEFSERITLTILNLNFSDEGTYSCVFKDLNKEMFTKNISLIVTYPSSPKMNDTNKEEMYVNTPEEVIMFCEFYGVPKPKIRWFKNGNVFNHDDSKRIVFEDDKRSIRFKTTEFLDEGNYVCEAANKLGYLSKIITLSFKNNPKLQMYYWIISFLVIFVLATLFFIIYKTRKELKLKSELREMGLAHFEKGAIENFNPELGIDDQAELLPYDKKWEYPRENLKLGKQLGSGAFGVVMKGEAKNICDNEEMTIVAVKMAKRNADNASIKALSSELKIMVHLGKHVNVVNILGACTKNVAKRELLVIVEYCRFGNIQNYLLRSRNNFINQIDSITGQIDYSKGREVLERTYSNSSNGYSVNGPNSAPYYQVSFSSDPILRRLNQLSSSSESSKDGSIIISNNSRLEWRSNRNDYVVMNPLCTRDLIVWSFQIARGMDYLSSRSVLHGDLAARNILLAEDNVVKICDFGLAKSMYKSDNYKKKGNGPLPIKWMAIESIRDRIFSTESDVWSFGIVLWELFSLGQNPYPGMEPNEDLYNKLVSGYRMEKPMNALQEIYDIILECWNVNPKMRPKFKDLSNRLGDFMEDNVKQHYINLNNPYQEMNLEQFKEPENDYLSMLSPPNFENLSSPNYINDTVKCDYLFMKSPSIENSEENSKEVNDDEVFTFDKTPNIPDETTKNETINEERISCYSNPNYRHININSSKEENRANEVKPSPNNYINMPKPN